MLAMCSTDAIKSETLKKNTAILQDTDAHIIRDVFSFHYMNMKKKQMLSTGHRNQKVSYPT